MNKYIAITIGPIFDTMNLSSSPVALWGSSYLFSALSKTICEVLIDKGIEAENIVTPFYPGESDTEETKALINRNDGVGLFPDRIILNANNCDIAIMNDIISGSIQKVAELFAIDKLYLQEYLMVEAVEFEAENPIIGSCKMLDSLELAAPYVHVEENNSIMSALKNDKIKESTIFASLKDFQLLKEENQLKSIEDITKTIHNDKFKKYKYYAIVRSDVDGMGKLINSLETDETIRDFSKNCLEYCSEIAEVVKGFGGVCIYAGGDDLLAILPCENSKKENVYNFVQKANDVLKAKFGENVSLSYGITMAYYKFPLYEALDDSAELLFAKAKSKKNCLAVRLQKHSGQSEGLIIPNSSISKINEYIKQLEDSSDELLLSALHKIALFEKSFNSVDNEIECYNLIKNTFDGPEHNTKFVSQIISSLFWWIKNESGIKVICENEIKEECPALTCIYLLRMIKFYFEKGDE